MPAPKENKYAIGNNGGRPPIFDTPEQLKKSIDEYFIYILGEYHEGTEKKVNHETGKFYTAKVRVWDRYPEAATITGLTLYLGFANRQSLYDYENNENNKEYSGIIKRARLRVEHEYEKNLHANNPTGSIFALKNMGWRDKTESEITGKDGEALLQPMNDSQVDRIISTLRALKNETT